MRPAIDDRKAARACATHRDLNGRPDGGVAEHRRQVLRRAAAEAIAGGRERITVGLLDAMGLRPPPTFSRFRF